jgi:enhancing lycopene biosynthesis protein 2
MSKKVAVILSGCGYLDGAEIREAVLSLLHLDIAGADVTCFAPNISQHHAIDHYSKSTYGTTRNVLEESARIARSEISELKLLNGANFDALILPGGFGVAKNFSDFAFKGSDAKVIPDLKRIIKEFNDMQKPIGAICIAPAVVVAALGKGKVTIGDDEATVEAIHKMGGEHVNCATTEICLDQGNKIVSTSAYMRDDKLALVNEGIKKLIDKTLELA